jgi:very-short-patch-repair endonuclease
MTENFIQKATTIHGDKYDYSKVKYINAKDKVIIICKVHGEFLQTAHGHFYGGCIKCAGKHQYSTEEFVEKATTIHGDKYDYSKTIYTTTSNKIIIICKIHGEFLQAPAQHLMGQGCKLCGILKNTSNNKLNSNDFIKKAMTIHGDTYDYSKVVYVKSNEKIIIICKIHGEFLQRPGDHLSGYGCKLCGMLKVSNNLKSNSNDFIKTAIDTHGDTYDYSKVVYVKSNEKIIIICKIHGEFLQTPKGHLRNGGCFKCAVVIRNANNVRRSTIEEFITKSKKIHGKKYDYSNVEYNNSKQQVVILCKIHGEFLQTPENHLCGYGCKLCGIINTTNKLKTSLKEVIENFTSIHKNKYDYSRVEYINSLTKVIIICKIHGEFLQKPCKHLQSQGCPLCVNKTEGKLYECLKTIYLSVMPQFSPDFIKPKRFDFCIPEFKIIIELDGLQHFQQVSNWSTPEKQLDNDKYKETCANDNGFSVIRLLQEDVFYDTYDWITDLCNSIEEIKNGDDIVNIYLCKNGEYDDY